MSLTDCRRIWVALRDAGERGLHSHDLRKQGYTGNPAQRMKDLVDYGQAVWTARENVGKRPGSRYWLADFAPDWAVPVRPNGPERGGDSVQPASLSVEPAPADTTEPVAIVRDWDGAWKELPAAEFEWGRAA